MDFVKVLKSWRFWGVVLVSVGWLAQQDPITIETITKVIQMILAGTVGIRTIDRFGEKVGASDTK